MSKGLLLYVCMLAGITAHAQVSMTVQVPAEGIIQKSQLWNFLVMNPESAAVQVKISLAMTDAVTGEPVLNAGSAAVSVNNGATLLLANNLGPLQYEYLSPRFTDMDPNGFLPVGQYRVCYTLNRAVHVGFEEISQECINIFVEPINPPMLTLPYDGSEEETNMPQFTWVPPAPLSMFSNLSYNFKLVEVAEGQTAAEAVQQNMPVYTISNYPDVFLNYPSSYTALDTGKLYAWQVVANNDNMYAAQSEVWTFKVKPPQIDSISKPAVQYLVFMEEDGDRPVYRITQENIYLKLYSWQQPVIANITLKDEKDKVIEVYKVDVQYGENYITLLLPQGLNEGKIYSFSMTDAEERVYSIKFMHAGK